MNDERLESLLRAAGRPPERLPPPRPDLADRVRRTYHRRRRTRQVSAAGIAAMLLLGGAASAVLFTAGPTHAPEEPVARAANLPGETSGSAARESAKESVPERERLLAEIARLDAEATRRHQKVERMLKATTTARPLVETVQQSEILDPLELARIEIEKTAFLLVDYAQRRSISADRGTVAAEYHRVVELFPHTNAAETARKRLNQLSIDQGDL